jgi:heme A synthase
MDILWSAHSWMRYVILIAGLLSLVMALMSVTKRTELTSATKTVIRVFVYALTAQALLGIIQLVVLWTEYEGALRHRMEHGALMLVVVGLAHYGMRFVRMPAPVGPRNMTIVLAGLIILIILGILILPQGMAVLGLA